MLIERIYNLAQSQPTRSAIVFYDRPITYAAFALAIDAARRFLEPHAAPAGRTAIISVDSPVDAWILLLALRSLGLNAIVERIETAQDLNLHNLAFVVATEDKLNLNKRKASKLPGIEIIAIPNDLYINVSGDLPSAEFGDIPFGSHMIYTSGSTGVPKKLLLDSKFEDMRNEWRARLYSFNKQTVSFVAVRLSTGLGAKAPPAVWHAGGCVVYHGDDVSRILRNGVNSVTLNPTLLNKFLRSIDSSQALNHDCELFVTAGFLANAPAEEVLKRVTKRLFISYATSELGTPLMLSRVSRTADMHWLTPDDARVIEIVDEHGKEAREGELRIRLSEVDCSSYLDDPAASAAVFRDGFFYPGDMAERHPDGRIRILGRVDNVLNVEGRKIATAPLEHIIEQRLGVDEVCLFSGLNAAGEEEIVVAVQSSRQFSRSEMEMAVRELHFPRIRVFVMKEFPRTDTETRKTRRSVLKQLIFSQGP